MAENPNNPQQGNGAGCWLIGIISAFLAMVLVIVALFLPPFNLLDVLVGEPYTIIQAEGEAVRAPDSGFTLAAATAINGELGVQIDVTSLQAFETGSSSAGEWIPEVNNAVPYYLALQSSIYSIETTGTAPDATLLSINAPVNVADTDLLDLYGWYEDDNGGEWRFIPSTLSNNNLDTIVDEIPRHVAVFQVAPDEPEVVVTYDVTTTLTEDVATLASVVAPAGLLPRADGTISGSLAAGWSTNSGYQLMPIIRNSDNPLSIDVDTVVTIISNPAARQTHVTELVNLTSANGFDGLLIDYRGLPAEQRDNFTAFIRDLSARLDGNGRSLGVVVPAAENVDGFWQTDAYDWRALGAEVDIFEIQMSINPSTYIPDDNQLVEAMLSWAVGEVDRTKIVLGLTALSVRDIAGTYNVINYDDALAGLGNVSVTSDNVTETGTIPPGSEIEASLDGRTAVGGLETSINTPYLDYLDTDGNTTARMWITTGNALRFRMNWTERFALGGVGFNDLLEDGVADGILPAISDYRIQNPTLQTTAEWALRWRIVGVDGEVYQTETTALDATLITVVEAPDGNYAVNPSVVLIEENIEQESVRTGAQVALFSATNTPTPLPTNTPTPIPTATPTLPPVIATNPPAPVNTGGGVPLTGGSAVIPGSGSLGGFEIGGHVTSTGSPVAINAMNQARMTWMKVQVRYSMGSDPGGAIAAVQQGQAAGFRVLIGTVGNPNELAANGDAYLDGYANWLGAIAAGGADGIEVWNEANIDREWPRDQISGAGYVAMLSRSHTAIRRGNSSTIIISAAPAPTGAEAAFPGQVVNDDNWLRQFVNAGGLQYVDCVGVHYNEGTVSANATSGDLRDNYYTRYLPTMVNVYRSIVGSTPLCFTELGYVTPEGYPPLPAFFSWGENTSVAEQSAWLAQAAAYLAAQGNVRMMIVWNVDFTLYAGDPQGGYAIVRPNGSCPACAALAAAR